jgi:hypothetical protein
MEHHCVSTPQPASVCPAARFEPHKALQRNRNHVPENILEMFRVMAAMEIFPTIVFLARPPAKIARGLRSQRPGRRFVNTSFV